MEAAICTPAARLIGPSGLAPGPPWERSVTHCVMCGVCTDHPMCTEPVHLLIQGYERGLVIHRIAFWRLPVEVGSGNLVEPVSRRDVGHRVGVTTRRFRQQAAAPGCAGSHRGAGRRW